MDEPQTLKEIMDRLRQACDGNSVSVDDILEEMGQRSFAPLILVPALLLVSPLSGIPGTPTMGAIIFILFSTQALLGRDHVWLPAVIRRRTISCARFDRAVRWLERPVSWIDDHTKTRFAVLARRPYSRLALVATIVLSVFLPFLELLPMVTSVAAFAISLLMIGKIGRDGVFMMAGYLSIAGFALLAYSLTRTVTG